MVVERLNRMPAEMARLGSQHNAPEIEDIILQKRWPMVECKVCGKMHDAAIRKVCDSEQGGEFQFCEPECPTAPSSEAKE